jgi:hypothetical protein
LKKGLFIFLLTFLIVPLTAILSVALNMKPWAVPIVSIVLFVGGLLRMAYALMFESTSPGHATLEGNVLNTGHGILNRSQTHQGALPPQQSVPVSSYGPPQTGKWRDTNELQPISVTEGTTKLLGQDQ